MSWHAHLALNYRARQEKTALHFLHDGPLRVLKSLYPEGPGICHNVLVHPPGGLVGGDVLDIAVQVERGAHGVITTPGATRFYKGNGHPAEQRTRLHLEAGARLEWLPLETIAYNACEAVNHLEFSLAEGAQLFAWDVTALGLPMANQHFDQGVLKQRIEWPGHFVEHGVIHASDELLLNGALGLDGRRCMGTLLFASGTPLPRQLREAMQESAHWLMQPASAEVVAGVTAPNEHMLLVRGLAPVVEPMWQLWKGLWMQWRTQAWSVSACAPRIWSM